MSSLIRQQQQLEQTTYTPQPASASSKLSPHNDRLLEEWRRGIPLDGPAADHRAPAGWDAALNAPSYSGAALKSSDRSHAGSTVSSDLGGARMHLHGTNYVSNVHWAAVLDSISDLKDHYEMEEEARTLVTSYQPLIHSSGPRLLYEPVNATKDEVLASVPERPIVDRIVARYFNAQGVAPGKSPPLPILMFF